MLNVLFIRALNARISASTPLVVNAVNPGYCYSNIRQSFSGVMAVVDRLMEVSLALPTETGSRQLVWGALGQEENPDKLRGEYLSLQSIEEVSDYILSPEGARVQDQIWVRGIWDDECMILIRKMTGRADCDTEQGGSASCFDGRYIPFVSAEVVNFVWLCRLPGLSPSVHSHRRHDASAHRNFSNFLTALALYSTS